MASTNGRSRSNERPLYLAGGRISAPDLETEQRYRLQRLRNHLRYTHGHGVVCGLQVVSAREARRPWKVRICPGYAISPCGDEILVPEAVTVDLAETAWQAPEPPAGIVPPPLVAYVGIRYDEEAGGNVPLPPTGCGCGCGTREKEVPSRLRDRYRIDVLWTRPVAPSPRRVEICTPGPLPCPTAETAHVLLARVTLPAGSAMDDDDIEGV